MKNLFIVCIFALLFAGCNNFEEVKEIADCQLNKDTIIVDDNSPILNQLTTNEVRISSYLFELSTSAIVKTIPNNYALIAAPSSGRIIKSFVCLGQEVNAWDPIFEISSPSFYEVGKEFYQTKEEKDLAYKNLRRQNDLLKKGVGIQKDFEEAEVNYAIKKKDLENAFASLRVYKVDTSNFILGQPLIVRSPIKGEIIENNIVIGQYVKEDSEPIATVAELDKICVAGSVKEKDIRYINDSSEVELSFISFPDKIIKGKIFHINSVIDEDTRSVQVLIKCNNRDKKIKPGMYVTTKFKQNINDVIIIPLTAIFQMDDSAYVFIMTSKNKYVKRKIDILTEDETNAIVKSGLEIGDKIVVSGGCYLLKTI